MGSFSICIRSVAVPILVPRFRVDVRISGLILYWLQWDRPDGADESRHPRDAAARAGRLVSGESGRTPSPPEAVQGQSPRDGDSRCGR